MVRKGLPKVKTGCMTCKIRKVKCDEARPACQRCTSTGRKCDGYPQPPQSHHNNLVLLGSSSAPSIIPALTSGVGTGEEGRALAFFRNVVAPALSTGGNDYFWRALVTQISMSESSIRHTLVAISSIYDEMGKASLTSAPHPDQTTVEVVNDGRWLDRSSRGRFAVGHYSQALRQLTSRQHDEKVYLLASVLFVCVELMQGHRDEAIWHCRHGVTIFNAASRSADPSVVEFARNFLLPVYARMSVFPHFFGVEFPALDEMDSDLAGPYATLDDARFVLDILCGRAVRFIRKSKPWNRCGDQRFEPRPQHVLVTQAKIAAQFDEWGREFAEFAVRNPCPEGALDSYHRLRTRMLVLRIWVSTVIAEDETAYDRDACIAAYAEIVQLCQEIIADEAAAPDDEEAKKRQAQRRKEKPKFIFEIGHMAQIYWSIITCRNLRLRLELYQAMRALWISRENLWHAGLLWPASRLTIEREHNVVVADDGTYWPKNPGEQVDDYPPDSQRAREVVMTDRIETRTDAEGQKTAYRQCVLIMPDPERPGKLKAEYLWHEIPWLSAMYSEDKGGIDPSAELLIQSLTK